mmetsp:Transcript_92949/g.294813  ORF Transcript_92949/g.294813 Transcript_92949/m.294813 type:complete len:258 (-) Transcript_92949:90-863(-)
MHTCMPAASAASTPFGASSNTMHAAGSILLSPSSIAIALRKISGSGFPRPFSSSPHIVCVPNAASKSSRTSSVFTCINCRLEDVARARGTFSSSLSLYNSSRAPGKNLLVVLKSGMSSSSRCCRNSFGVIGRPTKSTNLCAATWGGSPMSCAFTSHVNSFPYFSQTAFCATVYMSSVFSSSPSMSKRQHVTGGIWTSATRPLTAATGSPVMDSSVPFSSLTLNNGSSTTKLPAEPRHSPFAIRASIMASLRLPPSGS